MRILAIPSIRYSITLVNNLRVLSAQPRRLIGIGAAPQRDAFDHAQLGCKLTLFSTTTSIPPPTSSTQDNSYPIQ